MDSDQAYSATNSEIPRARRYEIGTAIRFRVRGEREWHEGANRKYQRVRVIDSIRKSAGPPDRD